MAQTPPFRNRPNLHIALSRTTGSPRHASYVTPASSTATTPNGTPLATTAYSTFRSASLKPPTPYNGPISSTSKREKEPYASSYIRFRIKRVLGSRPLWLLILLALLTFWWLQAGRRSRGIVRLDERRLGKELSSERRTKDLQFFPATNPKIHYVGRWSATPNRLRKDGSFPGVYFDVSVKNTTTLYLSLHNSPSRHGGSSNDASTKASAPPSLPSPGHLSFRPLPANEKPALPISLLARVNNEEYVLLANSSNLVIVCPNDLAKDEEHHVRIGAPMTENGNSILELEGLWLSKGGQLLRVEGSLLREEYADEDMLSAQNDQVGEKHRTGLNEILRGKGESAQIDRPGKVEEDLPKMLQERRKILEIITDSPGSFRSKYMGAGAGISNGLLAGVMGWEYLLGEMFGADHVGIGVDGMCLTQDCIGGVGMPAGIGDVFFRSGPYASHYFEHPWMFDAYVPDVIIINIGGSDHISFENHKTEYNKTAWDLAERFEQTYVSLIKAIRTLAYPKHPTVVHSERVGYPGLVPSSTPAAIPIFVMRPLRGQLEHATQNVVNRIRADGDKSVFWLDTSGWLDHESEGTQKGDMFFDETTAPPKWRLTEQGNQRVAIFLHMHVCRYLADSQEKCPFLPHEVYQGKVFDPVQADFDRFLEDEKERKLKKLFWGQESDEELDMDIAGVI